MKPKDPEKAMHADGKLHVRYDGPAGLTVGPMVFPHGVEVRLSPSKAEQIPDELWAGLTVIRPRR